MKASRLVTRTIVLGTCLACSAVVSARSERAAATRRVTIPRLGAPPVLDCHLTDEAWRAATVLGGFVQTAPGDNVAPSRATRVLIGRTSDTLFVAVEADDDPARVRARLARRDAVLDDDRVAFYLDTFRDRRRAYVVIVNPLGIQQDGYQVDGLEPDWSVDIVMQSRGCVTPGGYAIEMAVPFDSLRYRSGPDAVWGLHVVRHVVHLDEESSWMPLRRDKVGTGRTTQAEVRARFLSQAGEMDGFEELDERPVVEGVPVVTVSHPGAAAIGLTTRFAVTPRVGLDVAVNPDFAEVEADQPQLTANQRFPLFFGEKRPFFLEGADLLTTPLQAFHSRTIIAPDVAAKVTRRSPAGRATVLAAVDAGPGTFTDAERGDPAMDEERARFEGQRAIAGATRVQRDLGTQSTLGLMATTAHFVDRHNSVAGADGQIAIGPGSTLRFEALGTVSRRDFYDPEADRTEYRDGRGGAYFVELARSTASTTVQFGGEGYTRDYRADLGFTQRTDTNRWSQVTRYNHPPRAGSLLRSWSVLNTTLAQFDWRGRMQYAYVYPRLVLSLRNQTSVTLQGYRDYVRVFEEEFGPSRTPTRAGAFAGPSAERSTHYHGFSVLAGTTPVPALSLSGTYDRTWNALDYDFGAGPRFPRVSPAALADPHAPLDPGPGSTDYVQAGAAWQPNESIRVQLGYERSRLRRNDTGLLAFDQQLASIRVQYAISPSTWVRARVDRDSLVDRVAAQVVAGWTPRPGRAFYVGYQANGDGDRTVFVKLSWAKQLKLGRGLRQQPDGERRVHLAESPHGAADRGSHAHDRRLSGAG